MTLFIRSSRAARSPPVVQESADGCVLTRLAQLERGHVRGLAGWLERKGALLHVHTINSHVPSALDRHDSAKRGERKI